MKRQPYFPRIKSQRPEWFENLALQLPIANATLAFTPAEIDPIVNDARGCAYACGIYLQKAREFGPAATEAIEVLLSGTDGAAFTLPVFTPPPLPAGVTLPTAGALKRIERFVQTIKNRNSYNESIGLQLRIVGHEDATEHLTPEFTAQTERAESGACECVRLAFKKFGHQAVLIESRRGTGGWEMLGIDLASPYLDARPLLVANQPEVRDYRMQFYDNDAPAGDFTPPISVTVAP